MSLILHTKRWLKTKLTNKLINNILINYDTTNIDFPIFVKKKRLKMSSFSIKRLYYSLYEEKLVTNIIESYKYFSFEKVKELVDDNLSLLIFNRNYNAILKGALSSEDEESTLRYLIGAILSNVKVLDTVTFAHLSASEKYSSTVQESLSYCIDSELLSKSDRLILATYMGEILNVNVMKLNPHIAIRYCLMVEDWSSIIKLYKKERLNYNNKNVLNSIFMACLNMGDLAKAQFLYINNKEKLSNSNVCNYHFSRGDFISGYQEMKDRDMSMKCRVIFPDTYKQSIESLPNDENIIVLNSWGVGDDIRYSTLIPDLSKKFRKLQITCEPRLYSLFKNIYPRVKFLKTRRTKVVTIDNFKEYNNLLSYDLHHLMDNTLVTKISDDLEHFTLITDVVTQLKPSLIKLEPDKILAEDLDNKLLIDNFISGLVEKHKPIVGICWRSMISGTGRNSHYFDLDSLLECVKNRGVILVCLQYDLCSEDQSIAERYSEYIDYYVPPIDLKNDFSSVLYLMMRLDFIVSAGTAVLELAGLSGTKTFLLSNSYMQRYRFSECGNALTLTDHWFSNIEIVKDFEKLSKPKILRNTFNLIKKNIDEE